MIEEENALDGSEARELIIGASTEDIVTLRNQVIKYHSNGVKITLKRWKNGVRMRHMSA